MQSFDEALEEGFKSGWEKSSAKTWSYEFGDGYELCFEQLLFDNQYYVALYKNKELLTNKVVIKPGK